MSTSLAKTRKGSTWGKHTNPSALKKSGKLPSPHSKSINTRVSK